MKALFVADSFGKSFGSNTVLKSASVWVPAGSVTVLFGRNGCGKSTLIRCALGLHRAERGVVHFDGMSWPRPRLWQLARCGMFFLPDRGLLSGRRTFGEHLQYLGSRRRLPAGPDPVARLGVGHLLKAYSDEMSGGERRRAELALAALSSPRCLIADEPLAEIEPKDRIVVAEMLRTLAATGIAVLVTGHEVHELLALGDQIVWMTAGTTHGLGSPLEARTHDQFRREYLGPTSSA